MAGPLYRMVSRSRLPAKAGHGDQGRSRYRRLCGTAAASKRSALILRNPMNPMISELRPNASFCLALAALVAADVSPRLNSAPANAEAVLHAGMIGLDTSHVPAFAKLFNNVKATSALAGIK